MGESVHSAGAAEALGAYAHARRAGNLLFLAGLGPRRRGTKEIPGARVNERGELTGYDIEAEARACFENVRRVLEEAGSRWENIVDVTVFLTDLKRDFSAFNRVWGEFFPERSGWPTRTTVEVGALPQGGLTPIHVELKVVATV